MTTSESLDGAYVPKRVARSAFHTIQGLRYHVLEWGPADAPLLVMVHGWMDVAASFQFLVDAFEDEWRVIAPDWRGYGQTASSGQPSYWLPDYLADLDALLECYSPGAPVRLVGHSMGGNIATLYAGVRPERIAALVNLEGLGLPDDAPSKAPERMRRWLDELREPPGLKPYPNLDAVALRLKKTNPRLTDDRARFLASWWAGPDPDGGFILRADPAHKIINPYPHRADEVAAYYARVAAPVLWVMAEESSYAQRMEPLPDFQARLLALGRLERRWVGGAGHMMHHDQPALLAQWIESFLEEAASAENAGAQ